MHTVDSQYSHHTLGREFYIDFSSYPGDPGQFEVVSFEDNPLIGEITYDAETIVPYDKNLLFFPIPFEMLETYEEKPQFLVEVETMEDNRVRNMPAVCHSRKCDFTHIPAVGEITSFTFDASSKLVTVTGTNLPDNLSKIQSMRFAASACTASSEAEDGALDGTTVSCTLARNPTCGTWKPDLTTFFGNVPFAEGLAG